MPALNWIAVAESKCDQRETNYDPYDAIGDTNIMRHIASLRLGSLPISSSSRFGWAASSGFDVHQKLKKAFYELLITN